MDAASTDNPAPMALNVASLEGGPVAITDGRLELPIIDGSAVKLMLVADGNHMQTRVGLRQLMDAIGRLQYEVMSQQLAEERAARKAEAAEPITITVTEASVKDLPADDAHLEATAGNSGPGGQ